MDRDKIKTNVASSHLESLTRPPGVIQSSKYMYAINISEYYLYI